MDRRALPRLALSLAAAVAALCVANHAHARPCVARADLSGIISPATADYVGDAVARAEGQCRALLVVIDTPGGDLESTRRIVGALLTSRVPTIAYVGPTGARAGSAGLFVVLASDVAAMAPATTIGAAHPVLAGGQDPGGDNREHLGAKIENDAAAFARTLAERHGRNATWAESAVRDSRMATAAEALEQGVIDRIASDERALLEDLDGHETSVAGETVALELSGVTIERVELTLSQRVRVVLGHPTVAYLLLMLGLLGLFLEVTNPGLWIPGIGGVLSLVLAAIGLGALPVNLGGIALIVIGVAFLAAELFVTSYGLLLLAGAAAVATGSSLLVDRSDPGFFAEPSVSVHWGLIAPIVVVLVGAAGLLAWYAARGQQQVSPTGAEALVGARGKATRSIDSARGTVRLGGEQWTARAPAHIPPGSEIEVTSVDGLTLWVRPAQPPRERTEHARA